MIPLFYKIFHNFSKIFRGKNLVWHLVAIVTTFLLASSHFDAYYFAAISAHYSVLSTFFATVAIAGSFIPLYFPFLLLLIAWLIKDKRLTNTAWALGQAALLGSVVAALYKAVTGRLHPDLFSTVDVSRVFHFGFWREGIFWGWPSSHTTIAFAMAITLIKLYPKQRTLTLLALLYACTIGLGMTIAAHWFSDFLAGVIIGSITGVVVGTQFLIRWKKQASVTQ